MVERVLRVTRAELARVGLAGLSVPEVARKAGVNKTSLYRRWPTKDALAQAALDAAMAHAPPVADTGTFEGDLRALVTGVAAFVESEAGRAALRVVLGSAGRRPAARKAQALWTSPLGARPREVIARALARGDLTSPADGALVVFTLAGALLHRVLVERERADAAWVARVCRLISRGARPAPSRQGSRSLDRMRSPRTRYSLSPNAL